jgi:hypothetical protein
MPATPTSQLALIKELEDKVDQRSCNGIKKYTLATQNVADPDTVVQNLLQRFAVTSCDMGDDTDLCTTEIEVLSNSGSLQSQINIADEYSLTSKKDANDAASLTGTLSAASKGSNHSLKNTILYVLGIPGCTDAESLISSRSNKSQHPLKKEKSCHIERFVPVVSPRPDCNEPGIIRPGKTSHMSPFNGPGSPTNSLLSNDESLYIDESTIASLEMQYPDDLSLQLQHDAFTGTASVGELPSDCPEDEVTSKLQPGLVYLNRHKARKDTLDQRLEMSFENDTRRVQPMYNGVSVRPASQSRAGIFSRRQPKGDKFDNTFVTPEVTPELIVLRIRRTPEAPSLPVVDSQASHYDELQMPHVRFTVAGYYTEEPAESLLDDISTSDQSNTKDSWNSFLQELSKVEKQFFNPTGVKKTPGQKSPNER